MKIVNLVKNNCLHLAKDDESQSFFYKMIGDYYRYVAESANDNILDEVNKGALEGYTKAD